MRKDLIVLIFSLLTGCANVPKEYSWDSIDCIYQRGTDGMQRDEVRAKCDLSGRVELGRPELPFR